VDEGGHCQGYAVLCREVERDPSHQAHINGPRGRGGGGEEIGVASLQRRHGRSKIRR